MSLIGWHLWRAIIWPTLVYALPACGVREADARTLHVVVLARSPRHLTMESDAYFLAKFGIQEPIAMLHTLISQENSTQHDPYVFASSHPWRRHLREHVSASTHGLRVAPPESHAQHAGCILFLARR